MESSMREWLTIPQVSVLTGDSNNTTRAWIPYLPTDHVRLTPGGQVRLRREAVDVILRNKSARSAEDSEI